MVDLSRNRKLNKIGVNIIPVDISKMPDNYHIEGLGFVTITGDKVTIGGNVIEGDAKDQILSYIADTSKLPDPLQDLKAWEPGRNSSKRNPSRNLEHIEQVRFFNALRILQGREIFEAFLPFAVPNGSNKSPYLRNYFKAEGLTAGVPDIIVPAARVPYNGLAIEMKVKPNKPDPAQLTWIENLQIEKWKVVVAYSAVEAWAAFCNYFSRPDWLRYLSE